MQFFPVDIFDASAAMGLGKLGKTPGNANLSGSSGAIADSRENQSFQDIFSSLSAYNEQNTPGAAITLRSTRDDSSYFKSEDYKVLKEKLLTLGVPAKAVEEYFALLSQKAANPTIGQLRGTVSQMLSGNALPELDKQEYLQLRDILSKMGFSNAELVDVEKMLENGEGLKLLKAMQEKLQDKEFSLSKDDLDIIIKACDIYGEALKPITEYWEKSGLVENDRLTVKQDIFQKLFGTSMATLERRELDLTILSENLEESIQAMLASKKQQPAAEPVADMRGSALTERSETVSRLMATMLDEEEPDNEEEKLSTGHLMENKDADKAHKKGSIAASLLNNGKSEKAAKEEAQAAERAVLRGETGEEDKLAARSSGAATSAQEAEPRAAAYASAGQQNNAHKNPVGEAVQSRLAGQENAERAPVFTLNGEADAEAKPDARGDSAPRQDLFGAQRQSSAGSEADAAKAALNAKVHDGGATFGLFGQGENSSTSAQNAQSAQQAKSEIYHERIFEQVERGIIKNAADGSKQITLRLDPPELGKLTLSLTVAQGELKAVIRTESAATTQVVSEQLAQLKQSLEEQGFKVSSLEVETRAQSHAGTDNWNGTEQHNQEREMLEQARFLRLARTRATEGETLAQSMQSIEQPASISASGLHIIA